MARTDVTETKASHEVMDMVRGISAFSHMVFRLRESGLSWRDVKAVIDAERERVALNHHVNVAVRKKLNRTLASATQLNHTRTSARRGFDSQGKVSPISGRHGVPRTMRECCDKGGDMGLSRR